MAERHVPELDSLRGIAIVLVFLFHADQYFYAPPALEPSFPSLGWAFVRCGHAGVSLFFILSAFLLTQPFLHRVRTGQPLRIGEYFRRRALRILPLFWTTVVLAAVAMRDGSPVLQQVGAALPYFFFVDNLAPNPHLIMWSGPWWSLRTEVQFYLLLPLVALTARSRAGRRFLVAAGLAFFAWYAWLCFDGSIPLLRRAALAVSLLGRGPLFMLGAIAAYALAGRRERLRAALEGVPVLRRGGADAVLVALGLALGLVLQAEASIGPTMMEVTGIWLRLPEGILWTAVLVWLLIAPLRLHALIDNRVTRLLGLLSYSIFLNQAPVLAYLHFGWLRQAYVPGSPTWPPPLVHTTVVPLAVSVALAAVTYRLIERPFLRVGRPTPSPLRLAA